MLSQPSNYCGFYCFFLRHAVIKGQALPFQTDVRVWLECRSQCFQREWQKHKITMNINERKEGRHTQLPWESTNPHGTVTWNQQQWHSWSSSEAPLENAHGLGTVHEVTRSHPCSWQTLWPHWVSGSNHRPSQWLPAYISAHSCKQSKTLKPTHGLWRWL